MIARPILDTGQATTNRGRPTLMLKSCATTSLTAWVATGFAQPANQPDQPELRWQGLKSKRRSRAPDRWR